MGRTALGSTGRMEQLWLHVLGQAKLGLTLEEGKEAAEGQIATFHSSHPLPPPSSIK